MWLVLLIWYLGFKLPRHTSKLPLLPCPLALADGSAVARVFLISDFGFLGLIFTSPTADPF